MSSKFFLMQKTTQERSLLRFQALKTAEQHLEINKAIKPDTDRSDSNCSRQKCTIRLKRINTQSTFTLLKANDAINTIFFNAVAQAQKLQAQKQISPRSKHHPILIDATNTKLIFTSNTLLKDKQSNINPSLNLLLKKLYSSVLQFSRKIPNPAS